MLHLKECHFTATLPTFLSAVGTTDGIAREPEGASFEGPLRCALVIVKTPYFKGFYDDFAGKIGEVDPKN